MFKRALKLAWDAGCLLLMFTAVAVAQTAAAPHPTMSPLAESFIHQALPYVVLALGTVITAIAGVVALRINTFFGIKNVEQQKQVDKVTRDILHDAVWSGVKFALQKTGVTLTPGEIPDTKFIDAAMEYVHTKNPDVAAKIPDIDLHEIVVSKIPDLIKMLTDQVNVTNKVQPQITLTPAAIEAAAKVAKPAPKARG